MRRSQKSSAVLFLVRIASAERGFPFQLVAESKFGYKWIKWITTIELSANTDYLGYWESRGYPNDGDLPP